MFSSKSAIACIFGAWLCLGIFVMVDIVTNKRACQELEGIYHDGKCFKEEIIL